MPRKDSYKPEEIELSLKKLDTLYHTISTCHICPQMDTHKKLRLIQAITLKSDVFIISQSLAATQLRLSGINFMNEEGNLGNTGKNLEKFLNKFNRTVFPIKKVELSDKVIISKCNPNYISVYNTEIVQCYPGKTRNKGDRQPNSQEIHNCINKKFIIDEIKLIEPKILFLMGNISYLTFFKYILKEKPILSLSDFILEITNTRIPKYKIDNRTVYIAPIQHASGANPRFNSMIKNDKLIERISEVLI